MIWDYHTSLGKGHCSVAWMALDAIGHDGMKDCRYTFFWKLLRGLTVVAKLSCERSKPTPVLWAKYISGTVNWVLIFKLMLKWTMF